MIEYIDFSPQQIDNVEQARRLFHGRGHRYPGWEHLAIDWLPPVVLITLYKEEPHDNLMALAEQLMARLAGCRSVQVQFRCRSGSPTERLRGVAIEQLTVEVAGLKFQLQLGRRQNCGLFLDMSNGWQWLRERAEGKRVLNLFSYTCAFSVAAIAGAAESVVNVDLSKAALSRGRDNHRLNGQDTGKVIFQGVNIFKSFSRLKKYAPYDLLVCDPPLFQKGSIDLKRDYKKIIRRIPELMRPGGLMMLCLNAPELDESFLHETVAQACPSCRYLEQIAPPEVYVEAQPGKGLKVLIFVYDG
ncbi:MAG: class I SAM-dependent methyltransferase [Gammaproteobacteria bacterium]|nr:class I SAM-dependent methyltransferase [Gammaproteobacteria bacterium]